MPISSRWPLLVVGLIALSGVGVWSSHPSRAVRAEDPPRVSPKVTVYDPNPSHLWNRLHEALYAKLGGAGPDEPGELDSFLWEHSPYHEKGDQYKRAAAVLDEFIDERGDKLITDARKRALLQRDLWVLFDMLTPSRNLVAAGDGDSEIQLARRVAKILPQLALTAEQIKALPDNFAEAVAAKKFPEWFEANRLWDADGPWVLLGAADSAPLARTHVELFGGRSAFFVFLRLPEGREQARKYIAELAANGTATKVPQAAKFALVRQMLLIDDCGRITLSPVVESVQFRGMGLHEFKLSRKDFAAGKPSLLTVGPDDHERDFITLLRQNAGHGRDKVLTTCVRCHSEDTLQSVARHLPPAQYARPQLTPSTRDAEALHARFWKKDRYEWGLLQGLTLTPSRD